MLSMRKIRHFINFRNWNLITKTLGSSIGTYASSCSKNLEVISLYMQTDRQLYIYTYYVLLESWCYCSVIVYVCSLQRHLTQESEIKQQYEKKIDQFKQQLEKAEQKIIRISDELNYSIKERNVVIQARNQLAQDLQTEQERSEK